MKLYKYITGLLFTIIIFNSCTNNFEELNTRPDAIIASKVDASLLGQAFAQSQYFGMFGEHWRFQISQSLFADLYAQYFATTQVNFDSDRHVEVGRWIDAGWVSFYQVAAPQLKFVEDFTAENNMPVENAIAKIWKVQVYHRMTDYWGPIIYSEFGNGKTTVPYDTQEFIYRSFFVTLDEAVAVLKQNTGSTAFAAHDQVFDGDVNKWLTFANSLRLRLAMRVKYVDPGLSKTEAEKAVSDGVMVSNGDNAMLQTTINSRNPYWTITDWGEFRMSAAMESILVGYEDPRVGEYFSPAVNGDADGDGYPYEGLRNGLAKVDIKGAILNAAHSDMAPLYLNEGRGGPPAGAPMRIMSASEVFFLKAEGALEDWAMGGTARDLYNTGIEMSLTERTSASPGEIADYVSSTNAPKPPQDPYNSPPTSDIPVAFLTAGTKEEQFEQIITQKWIALYPDGWEAWTEVRRTGYPKLYARLNSENADVPADQIMRRVTFVDSEFSNNAEAVNAAVKLPEIAGQDKNSTRLWWDAK
jgi:hypothetical protein